MNPHPAPRGEVRGWSPGAVRRHTRWLYSVDAPALEAGGEVGYAVTLTMRHCPATDEEWVALKKAWLQRVRRLGATRFHWVVEWQKRGVPHIHAAVYFPSDALVRLTHYPAPLPAPFALIASWMEAAAAWEPHQAAQHYDRIAGALGWLKYLSKHAARGVRHYQRTGRPEGWEKTGRLWGYGGDWPVLPPLEFSGTIAEFHRLRRLIRAWRVADARAAGSPERIHLARRMLACPDRRLSSVRGVSDWVPERVSLRLLDAVLA